VDAQRKSILMNWFYARTRLENPPGPICRRRGGGIGRRKGLKILQEDFRGFMAKPGIASYLLKN
jgi:hypothetical protein